MPWPALSVTAHYFRLLCQKLRKAEKKLVDRTLVRLALQVNMFHSLLSTFYSISWLSRVGAHLQIIDFCLRRHSTMSMSMTALPSYPNDKDNQFRVKNVFSLYTLTSFNIIIYFLSSKNNLPTYRRHNEPFQPSYTSWTSRQRCPSKVKTGSHFLQCAPNHRPCREITVPPLHIQPYPPPPPGCCHHVWEARRGVGNY